MVTESTDLPDGFGRRGSPPPTVEPEIRSASQREPRRRATRRMPRVDVEHVAQALSWLSIGLGLTALLAPRPISNFRGSARVTDCFARLGWH